MKKEKETELKMTTLKEVAFQFREGNVTWREGAGDKKYLVEINNYLGGWDSIYTNRNPTVRNAETMLTDNLNKLR